MPSGDESLRDRQIVVMGVMGAGKTTVGLALSERLGCPFYDADDLHPESNRRKIGSGVPLTAEEREPWVARVAALIAELHEKRQTGVIACSALTQRIRAALAAASDRIVFVHLVGTAAAIRERLAAREGHFADPELLGSQYATLEMPAEAIVADASQTPEKMVEEIILALRSRRTV